MATGKFSKPRTRFTPENDISRIPKEPVAPVEPVVQEAPVPADIQEEMAIEQAFLEVSGMEEEPEHELPLFLEKLLGFVGRNRKVVLVSACAVVLILLVSIISIIFFGTALDPYDGRILNNVTIAGINVGGMTRSEAEAAVRAVTDDTFTRQDMVIELSDTTLRLSPDKTGAKLDVKAAVKAAYQYGRTGTQAQQKEAYENSFTGNHTIGLLPYLNLDEEYIWSVLNDYASQFSSTFTETTYEVVGDMPALEADKFNENTPCQTLVIVMGTPGLGVDMEDLYNSILDAYSFNKFQVIGDVTNSESVPEPLDLQAIYDELYIAPINATVDSTTFEPIPGVYGYGFDLKKAQQLLDAAQYGDILEIPMEYISPDVTEDGVLFRDVLGECQTPHTDNEKRNTNLRLACAALNGVVLDPGEVLSYNDTVGQRTAEKGYMPAPAYSGHSLVDSLGGGVCQVSSTLYYCALLSDMEIVFRVNHGYSVSYMDLGLDATVNWGGPDFQFKNNTNYPIKIEAEVSGGYVKMRILGTDEKDYYVKMEYEITGTIQPEITYEDHSPDDGYYDGQILSAGVTGYYVKTYRCKYDKETDKLISRDFEARSSYMGKDILIVRFVGDETEPSTEPTQPNETTPSEGTTPPESTQPSEPPASSEPPTSSEPPASTEAPAPTDPPAPAPSDAPAPDPAPGGDAPVGDSSADA